MMLARDEFKKTVNHLSSYLTYPVLDELHKIDDHDANQRQKIVELEQALEFYADPQNYCLFGGSINWIREDAGKLARRMLGRSEG